MTSTPGSSRAWSRGSTREATVGSNPPRRAGFSLPRRPRSIPRTATRKTPGVSDPAPPDRKENGLNGWLGTSVTSPRTRLASAFWRRVSLVPGHPNTFLLQPNHAAAASVQGRKRPASSASGLAAPAPCPQQSIRQWVRCMAFLRPGRFPSTTVQMTRAYAWTGALGIIVPRRATGPVDRFDSIRLVTRRIRSESPC
jgi:hypothetical protein